MAKVKLPYIAWRDGRPRFQPGPRERALGFLNADLKHGDGRWFSLDETRGFAEARLREIAARRAGGKPLRRPPAAPGRTVEDLLEAFLASGRFRRPRADGGYAEKTREDYRKKADVIVWRPGRREKEPFAQAPARAITPGLVSNDETGGLFEYLRRTRGLSTARGAVMVLSAAYKWGRKAEGWQLRDNPCTRLGLPKPRPAPEIFTYAEFGALVAYGDHPAIAEHGIVDACFIALFSGQRPADVLAYDGAGTSDGVTRLVQGKRGRRVEIPQLPPLTARLAAMAARRQAEGWHAPALVIDDRTGRGFVASTFQHRFAALRDMVAAGRRDLDLAAVPAIARNQFKFLRKTALTWMKRAKVPDNQFAAVSGHALASLPQVMEHYYTPGSEDAAEAMSTLWAWMQTQGMTG